MDFANIASCLDFHLLALYEYAFSDNNRYSHGCILDQYIHQIKLQFYHSFRYLHRNKKLSRASNLCYQYTSCLIKVISLDTVSSIVPITHDIVYCLHLILLCSSFQCLFNIRNLFLLFDIIASNPVTWISLLEVIASRFIATFICLNKQSLQ